jgi:hypothetical protein
MEAATVSDADSCRPLPPEQQAALQRWQTFWIVARFCKLLPQAALVIGSLFVSWISRRNCVLLFFSLEIGGRYAAFFAERAMSSLVGREPPTWWRLLITTGLLAALCLMYSLSFW